MQTLIFLTTLLYFITEGAMFSRNEGTFSEERTNDGGQEKNVMILADVGTNISLPCGEVTVTENRPVMWGRQGYGFARNTIVQPNGSLFFSNLLDSNAGIYSCQPESYENDEGLKSDGTIYRNKKGSSIYYHTKTWFQLKVRTPPYELRNVTVLASTILASVMWDTGVDGGYPISSFHIRYRLKNSSEEDWISSQPSLINPTQRHWDVFHLCPKSDYIFEIWANNQLGKGVSTFVEVTTHNDMQEIQVGKYLLEGVDTFDTRVWLVAVGVVLGTLCVLGMATCCLLYKEYSAATASRAHDSSRRRQVMGLEDGGDGEDIELIPNIIFNPVFDVQATEIVQSDENSNNTATQRSNNHSVIFPTRV